MHEKLRRFLESMGPLSDEDWEVVASKISARVARKSSFLLRPGEIAQSAYFVADGLLRIFSTVDGKEQTRNFFSEGSFFSESLSFFTGRPSPCHVEALEDCNLLQIQKADSETVFDHSLTLSRIGRRIFSWSLAGLASRTMEMMESNGTQRYLELRQNRSDLFQRVPQYMIASYLGLSPEALSRIISKAP